MIFLSLIAFLCPTMAQISEEMLLLGSFNAASQYSSDGYQFNLTQHSFNSSSYLYQVSQNNDSIVPLGQIQLNNSLPSAWQQTSDPYNSVIILEGQPYICSDNSLSPLIGWEDVEGTVSSLFYDEEDDVLYLGGDLSYNSSYGALAYDYESEKLMPLAFGGFNKGASVNTITKYTDSIFFGGDFYSIGKSQYLNESIAQNTTDSNNSTSLVKDVSQMIPINSSSVSSTAGSDADGIVCPDIKNPSTWRLPSGELGSWSASLQIPAIPNKVRLFNSKSNDEGVSYFRIVTSPANSIMNLTYVDPETLSLVYCDAFCPLLQSNDLSSKVISSTGNTNYETFFNDNTTVISVTTEYQDFAFVNFVEVEKIEIEVMEYYGSNAALDGIELFRSGITVFADNTLNERTCSNDDGDRYTLNVYSESLDGTNWEKSTEGSYLVSTVSSDNTGSTIGLRYNIEMPVSGQYEVLIYTPGCAADNTCNKRGIVQASLYQGDGTMLASDLLYQTNEQQKYDTIYSGDIKYLSSPAYIEVVYNQSLSSEDTIIVAGSVQFNYLQLDVEEYFKILNNDDTLAINGIFEYSLNNFSLTEALVSQPIGKTPVNVLGSDLNENATISNIAINNTAIILSGDFEADNADHIIGFEIDKYNDSLVLGSMLSIPSVVGAINGAFGTPEELLLYGASGLSYESRKRDNSNVLFFHGVNSSFSTLEIGTTSRISSIASFFFNSSEYFVAFENNQSSLFSVSSTDVFKNSDTFNISLDAVLQLNETDSEFSTVMGNILQFEVAADNILNYENFTLNSVQNTVLNVSSGLYINETVTLLGGDNIYLLGNNQTKKFIDDFELNGTITSLMYYNQNLYFSFDGDGFYKTAAVENLASYNIHDDTFKAINSTILGEVKTFVIDPQFDTVIIGGNFTIDGKCSDLCTVETGDENIMVNRTLFSNLAGTINFMNYFAEYQVLIGGEFVVDDDAGFLGVYNTVNGTVEISSISESLPGSVSKFIFVNETKNEKTLSDEIIIMGSDYLGYYKNSSWTSLTNGLYLDESSRLEDISLISVDSDSTSFFDNQVLLLTGYFKIENKGFVSSAYYDGQEWIPLSITAKSLEVQDAYIKSIVKSTSMFVLFGSFTATSSSTYTSSSGTSTAEPTINNKGQQFFTSGQVVGVSLALAIGTTLFLAGCAWLLYATTSSSSSKEDLANIEEKEEKMMNAVPPDELIINNN